MTLQPAKGGGLAATSTHAEGYNGWAGWEGQTLPKGWIGTKDSLYAPPGTYIVFCWVTGRVPPNVRIFGTDYPTTGQLTIVRATNSTAGGVSVWRTLPEGGTTTLTFIPV